MADDNISMAAKRFLVMQFFDTIKVMEFFGPNERIMSFYHSASVTGFVRRQMPVVLKPKNEGFNYD